MSRKVENNPNRWVRPWRHHADDSRHVRPRRSIGEHGIFLAVTDSSVNKKEIKARLPEQFDSKVGNQVERM